MFEEIKPKHVEKALTELRLGEYNERYRVWHRGNLIPPKVAIRKAYEIAGKKVPVEDKWTTNTAQNWLIANGFPIMDTKENEKNRFFTKKDLWSFKILINRQTYDKTIAIDGNIGSYLSSVSWGKTKLWRNELVNLGWEAKGAIHWNVQRKNKTGQAYQKYTWYRIFPKDRKQDLIYFTIGIEEEGYVVYKMDIQRNHSFFTNSKESEFDRFRKEVGAGWQVISENDIDDYSWDKLISKSHSFFQKHLENYYKIEEELLKEKRLMRLTWNINQWELPCGHDWDKKHQGTSEAYERQYGYGLEEWLFNSRYRIKDNQYGYIRGVNSMDKEAEWIDELFLFTINPETNDRFLVAKLYDVEIIVGYESEQEKIRPIFKKFHKETLAELDEVGADYKQIEFDRYLPNIKFPWSKTEILNEPILLNELKGGQFNRFQPYKISDRLESILEGSSDEILNYFKFNSGKASTVESYEKNSKGGRQTVNRKHSKITDDLYDYLNNVKGIDEDSLSAEKTRVGGAIVDLALAQKNAFTLFEIKTSSTGLSNIRQAIGQLFEYAFLDSKTRIKKMVIVGPTTLRQFERDYLNILIKNINVPLEYWAYLEEEVELKNRFKVCK